MKQLSKKKDPRVQTAPDTSGTNVAMAKTSSDPCTYTEKEVHGFVGNVLDMAVQLLEGKGKKEASRQNLEDDLGSPAPARKKRALGTDKEVICSTPATTAEPPQPTVKQSLLSNTASRKKKGSRQNTRVKSQDLYAARRLQRETPLASWMEHNTTVHGKVRDWHTRPILFNSSVPSPRDNKLPTRRFYGVLACAVMSTEYISAKITRHLKAPADYDSHEKLLSTRVSVGLPAMNAAGQILLVDGIPMLGFLRDLAEQFPAYDKIEATAKAAVYGKDAAWYEQKFRDTNARHLSHSSTGNQNGPEAVKPTHVFPLFLLHPGLEPPHIEPADMLSPSPPRNSIHTTAFPGFSSALPRASRSQTLLQPASVHDPTIRQSVPNYPSQKRLQEFGRVTTELVPP
ncbi:hypothetical protein BOTNAR_0042g00240 [Botryotinia narcissicola]|uniref:Uncharacterized protein n=1 Tax=Botryotinia narcissicola TaxID=278944 RepID=A0A4Z1J1B1_9HELO|nr:hypothetical protein BOTNAR_0042g00240 [Botryotinia narcissicola]